ncbi:hypothetical protein PM8797T_27874 [Gimesia maris DSM 8797]|uniref:Uncharacterized protein n=1 Tax=Gimesia maris TaxID=122 RepID=A0ABX5YP12_9PLAN|nr:hypothetical protein PM8797T_27874 [Gimesia maris DSM 8797]QDU15315.1 hypothetical protein CA11_31380 [Gimesia maris]QEG17372.1 hypothetical protein GmarT_32520 [Gimesia maris]
MQDIAFKAIVRRSPDCSFHVTGTEYTNRIDTKVDSHSDVPWQTTHHLFATVFRQASFEFTDLTKIIQFLLSKPAKKVQTGYTLQQK